MRVAFWLLVFRFCWCVQVLSVEFFNITFLPFWPVLAILIFCQVSFVYCWIIFLYRREFFKERKLQIVLKFLLSILDGYFLMWQSIAFQKLHIATFNFLWVWVLRLWIVYFCEKLLGIVFGNVYFLWFIDSNMWVQKNKKIYIIYSSMLDVHRQKKFLKKYRHRILEIWCACYNLRNLHQITKI